MLERLLCGTNNDQLVQPFIKTFAAVNFFFFHFIGEMSLTVLGHQPQKCCIPRDLSEKWARSGPCWLLSPGCVWILRQLVHICMPTAKSQGPRVLADLPRGSACLPEPCVVVWAFQWLPAFSSRSFTWTELTFWCKQLAFSIVALINFLSYSWS